MKVKNSGSDWRLTNQEKYLKGVTLTWRKYSAANPENDHDHCEFCWAKFMVVRGEDILDEGYSTEDGYRWICKSCVEDFKEQFDWKIL